MTNDGNGASAATVLDSINETRKSLSVRRVFGEPYELGGLTVIPVARIAGGAGGGGGEGAGGKETGSGFGSGFGVRVQPMGVFRVRDGDLEWKPILDTTRVVHGGQVLAGIIAVCLTLVALRRRCVGCTRTP